MLAPELLGGLPERARRPTPPQSLGWVRELASGGTGDPPSGPCGLVLERTAIGEVTSCGLGWGRSRSPCIGPALDVGSPNQEADSQLTQELAGVHFLGPTSR